MDLRENKPVFGGVQLRAPVLQPPFHASSAAAVGNVHDAFAPLAIGDGDALDGALAGRASGGRLTAPPLGGPYFDEADEDAVWSDEDGDGAEEQRPAS